MIEKTTVVMGYKKYNNCIGILKFIIWHIFRLKVLYQHVMHVKTMQSDLKGDKSMLDCKIVLEAHVLLTAASNLFPGT